MKNIHKIVLTGGPCAGKSTALKVLQKHFTELGYRVLIVSETATDLLSSGVSPFNMDNVVFQTIVTSTMRFKESMMMRAANTVPEDKVLIVCDRAQMDNTAYMTDEELRAFMKAMKTNRVEMRDGYDAVFHLETAAKGAPTVYSQNFSSNPARYESIEEAVEIDSALLRGWVGHPHLRVIKSDVAFDTMMEKLVEEVEHVVGVGGSFEIERKFLISYPDEELLRKLPFCRCVDIEQCYVKQNNQRFRVRRRGEDGHYIYTRTKKKHITDEKRIEIETSISENMYKRYVEKAYAKLEKKRYCICEGDRYLELDVYPYSDIYAICEVETLKEKETIKLPDYIEVLSDVTGGEIFSNRYIAQHQRLYVLPVEDSNEK